jgi:hypothetical protein
MIPFLRLSLTDIPFSTVNVSPSNRPFRPFRPDCCVLKLSSTITRISSSFFSHAGSSHLRRTTTPLKIWELPTLTFSPILPAITLPAPYKLLS